MSPRTVDLSPDFVKAIAWLILAIAALLIALALLWLLVVRPWKKFTGHIETKLGSLELAVNGVDVANGEEPLIDKVRALQAQHEWSAVALVLLAEALHIKLPPPPPTEIRRRTARSRKGDHP